MTRSIVLTIVRHGETNLNAQRVLQGHFDESLNEKGKLQAQLLGKHICDKKFSRIYSSDLERAQLTAKIILEHSNHLQNFPIFLDKRLRERGYGSLEMKPVSELIRLSKESGQKAHIFTPEGGETYQNVQDRIKSFLTDIFDFAVKNDPNIIEEETILVVTHGGFIRLFFEHLHSNELFVLKNFNLERAFGLSANTGVTQLEIQVPIKTQNSIDSPKHIVNFIQLHDTTHLLPLL